MSGIMQPMMGSAPPEARWVRPEPRRGIPALLIERMARTAFPLCRVTEARPLAGGLRNANFKLHLDCTAQAVVLRIYEHDGSLCRKEADLIRLVGGRIPVPEVIHVEPLGWEDVPPFALLRYVEGITFRELKKAGNAGAIAEAARLVHGDFGKRNLLVRNVGGKWAVAALLDWEFAVSGAPLADLGHFVCYERSSRPLVEPHFSKGYLEAGGTLPEDWRQVARIVDLTSLCESLTHEYLLEGAVPELVELVRATVENRDPQ